MIWLWNWSYVLTCTERGTLNTSHSFPHLQLGTTSLKRLLPQLFLVIDLSCRSPSSSFLLLGFLERSSSACLFRTLPSFASQDVFGSLGLPSSLQSLMRTGTSPCQNELLYVVHESIISGLFSEITKGGFHGGIGCIGWSYCYKAKKSWRQGSGGWIRGIWMRGSG